ncbi:hypothetical protein D3C81_1140890 [compost metagenome]
MELAAVDIGQVMAAYAALGVGQQRLGDQFRAEERATDTDVDHVGDRLLAVAAPQPVMDTANQLGDLVEDFVHFRHHVDAVDTQFIAYWPAQCGVQGRAAF